MAADVVYRVHIRIQPTVQLSASVKPILLPRIDLPCLEHDYSMKQAVNAAELLPQPGGSHTKLPFLHILPTFNLLHGGNSPAHGQFGGYQSTVLACILSLLHSSCGLSHLQVRHAPKYLHWVDAGTAHSPLYIRCYHKKCSWQLIFCQCTLAQLARGVHVATAAACRRPVWLKCCTTIDSTPHKHHTPSVPSLSIPQRTHARRHHTAMCDYSCSCCIRLPCCNQNV